MKFRLNTFILLCIAILLSCFNSDAQVISETQWFFGQSSANLQFDKNGINVYDEERMNPNFGRGGSAVISNPYNGNLLFYTDGQRIYDASHTDIMPANSGITGNPDVNQAAVAMSHPTDSAHYYFFINNESSISYVLLDGTSQGNGNNQIAFGEVTETGDMGIPDPSEGMIIIPNATNSNYWLISQNRDNFDFNVTQINRFGIGATQVYALDTSTQVPGFEAAQFDFNEDSSILAVAPKDPNRNILLLDFNFNTGNLSINRQLRNTGFNDNAGENVYDVQWSGDGSRLYFSRFGSEDSLTANLYQYDLTDTIDLVTALRTPFHRSYGLRRGIDNRMYHLYQEAVGDTIRVGRLENLDSLASVTFYEPNLFNVDFNGFQFPAFASPLIPFSPFSIDIFAYETCTNNQTKFFPIVTPVPDIYEWTIEGVTYSQIAPIVRLQNAIGQTVDLTVELNGVRQTYSEFIEITSIDEEINVGNDTTICENETITIPVQPFDFQVDPTYLWSTGETTAQIEVDTFGIYWVEATFGNGCSIKDYIEITEYGVNPTLRNQWYFGDKAALDFNEIPNQPDPPRALTDSEMFASEGCATVSDLNGELLFYTNGDTIWNKEHELMQVLDTAGGINLGGDLSASQGALILPFMGDSTMYYVFSAREVYGDEPYRITYSIVDMKVDSARGAVVIKNLPLADNVVEKITATAFEISSWLTTHEFGNNNFRNHLITESGINNVVHTPMGEVLDERFEERAGGSMKYNLGRTLLVNLIPGTNQFEIFDFESIDGRFSNPRLIDTGEPDELYGVEISTGSSKLYVSTPDALIQYNLDSIDTPNEITEITSSKFYLAQNPANEFGAIQRAPNNILYVAIDNGEFLHSIQNPEELEVAANYNANGANLGGANSKLGLPNYIFQNAGSPQTPGLQFINACLGQETQFIGTGTDPIDEFFWTLEDALLDGSDTTANGENITYSYPSSGPRLVTLEISNRCGYQEFFTDTVTVFEIPEQPIFPDETNLCAADSLVFELWFEDRNDLSFNWVYVDPNTGGIVRDSSRTLFVDESLVPTGTLRDFEGWIENADGCRSDTLQITSSNNRPFVDLGFDQQVCQFDEVASVNANVSGVTFQWWLNGQQLANEDTTRLQSVSTASSGVLEYVVRIQEPFFGCTQNDTLQITVQEAPQATGMITPPTLCGAQDAILSFDIATAGSFQYNLDGQNLLDAGTVDGPGPSTEYTGLGAGTYQLQLENIVTGCTSIQPLIIEDDVLFDLTASNLPNCQEGVNLQMTLSGTQLPDFVRIYIEDALGDTVFTENETTVPIQVYPGLENGLYNVTVIDRETGCIQADSVLIQPLFAAEEDCQPEIFAPTAFSPNGNGQNETFFVYPNAFIEEFEIFIYSRWGELVFYSDQQDFQWDGIYQGQILGPATYAYVIKFTSSDQPALGTLTQFGSVTIIK